MRQSQRHSNTPTKQQKEEPVKNKLEVQSFCLSHKYTAPRNRTTGWEGEEESRTERPRWTKFCSNARWPFKYKTCLCLCCLTRIETVKYDLVWPTEQKRAVRRKNTNLTLYQSQAAEKHNKQEKDSNSQSAEAAVHERGRPHGASVLYIQSFLSHVAGRRSRGVWTRRSNKHSNKLFTPK